MKIRDLVRRTDVTKETVHYYIREGLLPKPRKRGRNIADYDEGYVDRISMIKELQDNYFLPLSLIKNILKNQKKSSEGQSFPGRVFQKRDLGSANHGRFFNHLYRKLSGAEYERLLMENGMKGGNQGEREGENS